MARLRVTAAKRAGLHHTPLWSGPEGASQTFLEGELLKNSSGFIVVADADDDNCIGFSAEPGHNSTSNGDNRIKYIPLLPHVIFEANIDDSGDLGNGAYVDADHLKKYGLNVSSNVWYIDKADTTNTVVTVLEPILQAVRDSANAATNRVQARVTFAYHQDKTLLGAL